MDEGWGREKGRLGLLGGNKSGWWIGGRWRESCWEGKWLGEAWHRYGGGSWPALFVWAWVRMEKVEGWGRNSIRKRKERGKEKVGIGRDVGKMSENGNISTEGGNIGPETENIPPGKKYRDEDGNLYTYKGTDEKDMACFTYDANGEQILLRPEIIFYVNLPPT